MLTKKTPCLPQHDPKPERRAAALAKERGHYSYSYDRFHGIAMLEDLPRRERPALGWVETSAEKMLTLLINSAAAHHAFVEPEERECLLARIGHFLNTDVREVPGIVRLKAEEVRGDMRKFCEIVECIKQHGVGWAMQELVNKLLYGSVKGWPAEVAGYDILFQKIERPSIAADYSEDAVFARMRLAGPNPMLLTRISGPDDRFPVSEAMAKAALGEDDSLAAAGAEGRLYQVDLSGLASAEAGAFPHGQKYLCAPLALFGRPRSGGLVPIAIQCAPEPGPQNPIFTPRDGLAWLRAKAAYTTADGNAHQAISHLAQTHLVLEPFAMATRRQLSERHPLHVLLAPHIEGTLSINDQADTLLCKPEGGVDAVLSGSIETSRSVAAAAVADYDFNARMPHRELAARGVDDGEALPDFPYRDDALLLWDAIRAWVGEYVGLYYTDDAELIADAELRAWAAEITAREGGRIQGFGDQGDGRIQTCGYLVEALSHIIFTASVQHAAVNFPQWELMGYPLNYPLSAYAPAPSGKETDAAAYVAQLPPLDMALFQLEWGYLLGQVRYTQLGRYPDSFCHHQFSDPRVKEPLTRFQARLDSIENEIEERNQGRVPYKFLRPSLVPQSINI